MLINQIYRAIAHNCIRTTAQAIIRAVNQHNKLTGQFLELFDLLDTSGDKLVEPERLDGAVEHREVGAVKQHLAVGSGDGTGTGWGSEMG